MNILGLSDPLRNIFLFKTHPFRNILLAQTHPLRNIWSSKTHPCFIIIPVPPNIKYPPPGWFIYLELAYTGNLYRVFFVLSTLFLCAIYSKRKKLIYFLNNLWRRVTSDTFWRTDPELANRNITCASLDAWPKFKEVFAIRHSGNYFSCDMLSNNSRPAARYILWLQCENYRIVLAH